MKNKTYVNKTFAVIDGDDATEQVNNYCKESIYDSSWRFFNIYLDGRLLAESDCCTIRDYGYDCNKGIHFNVEMNHATLVLQAC